MGIVLTAALYVVMVSTSFLSGVFGMVSGGGHRAAAQRREGCVSGDGLAQGHAELRRCIAAHHPRNDVLGYVGSGQHGDGVMR